MKSLHDVRSALVAGALCLCASGSLSAQSIADLRLSVRPTRDTLTVGDSLYVTISVINRGTEWVRAVIPFESDYASVAIYVFDQDRESVVNLAASWKHSHYQSTSDSRFETSVPAGGAVTWSTLVGTIRAGPGTYPIVVGVAVGAPAKEAVVTLRDSSRVVVRPRAAPR